MIVLFQANLNKAVNNFLPLSYSRREQRVAIMMRILASHQCGPGFMQDQCHKISYSMQVMLVVGSCIALRVFSECSGYPPSWRTNYNSSLPVLILWLIWLPLHLYLSLNIAIHLFVCIICKGFIMYSSYSFCYRFSHFTVKDLLTFPAMGYSHVLLMHSILA